MMQTEIDTTAQAPADAAELTPLYEIRRKVLKLAGAEFRVTDYEGQAVGHCRQKAFKLKEDLRFYTDAQSEEELFRVRTPSVIDFSAVYEVVGEGEAKIGAFKRHGGKSLLRDTWSVLDAGGETIATIREDSSWKAALRRLHEIFDLFLPTRLRVMDTADRQVAEYQSRFNPFIQKRRVLVAPDQEALDPLLVLAGACLLMAINKGRR